MRRTPTAALATLVAASLLAPVARGAEPAGRSAEPTASAPARPVIACPADDPNLKTYLQMHDVLFMQRDGSRAGEFYAPELISHNLDSGGGAAMVVKTSDLAHMWAASKKNDPERKLVDDLIICQGGYVVVRTMVHGMDNVGVDGHPPTGKRYTISATDIYRFENGKVVERWGNSDLISMYRQLGYALTPAAAQK
jgi:predicted SnoaL-like aldol condensation-catalyzing enzyme